MEEESVGVAFSRRVSSRAVVAEQLHPGPVVPGERRMPRVSDVVADDGGRRFAGLVVAGADAGGEGKATESVRGIGKAWLTRSAEAIHLKGQEETPLERFALPLGDARREPWQIRRTRAHVRGEVPLDPTEGDPSVTPLRDRFRPVAEAVEGGIEHRREDEDEDGENCHGREQFDQGRAALSWCFVRVLRLVHGETRRERK